MRRALEYAHGARRRDRPARRGPPAHRGRAGARGRGRGAARAGRAGPPPPRRRSSPATARWPARPAPRLHVCHVSSAHTDRGAAGGQGGGRAGDAPRSRRTTCCSPTRALAGYDPVNKVNPPLRTGADTEAMRAALAEGVIDVVATDHAPHAAQYKDTEWDAARPGMLGLQTALSVVVHTMVEPGLLDWRGVARVLSERPGARSAGCPTRAGRSRWGSPPPSRSSTPTASGRCAARQLASRAANTPYEGMRLPGHGGRDRAARPDHRAGREGASAGRMTRGAGARGRPDLPRRALRRRRAEPGRGGVHHRHDRLPGDADRPVATTARSSCRPPRRSATPAGTTRTTSRAAIQVAGYVVRDPARTAVELAVRRPLGRRAARAQGIVGVAGVDTRALVRHLRERGAMRAGVFSGDALAAADGAGRAAVPAEPAAMVGADLYGAVTTPRAVRRARPDGEHPVPGGRAGRRHQGEHAADARRAGHRDPRAARGRPPIERDRGAVARTGSSSPTAPATRPPPTCRSRSPGRCWSGGSRCSASASATRSSARALGRGTYKLRYGHRGINIPVVEHATGRVAITSQNHGFAVEGEAGERFDTPFGPAEITHTCPNDGCVEGLRALDVPAFSVQYHPEAAAGPARRRRPVRPVRRARWRRTR